MIRGYYFITDAALSRSGDLNDVRAAVSAGVTVVQYRNKGASSRAMLQEALLLRESCRKSIFIVNDRVDIALASGADGVHLGQDDLPCRHARKLLGRKRIIGLTVHTLAQALDAQKDGVDYIGVAPIFPTATKSDAGSPVGLTLLRKIRSRIKLPIVAIGGIDLENAPAVIKAGADALCAISAVVTQKDVRAEIMEFQHLFATSG